MTTFRKEADGALRWDRGASKASERWGPNAKRPDFVEACQDLIIKKGMTEMIWDTRLLVTRIGRPISPMRRSGTSCAALCGGKSSLAVSMRATRPCCCD